MTESRAVVEARIKTNLNENKKDVSVIIRHAFQLARLVGMSNDEIFEVIRLAAHDHAHQRMGHDD